jgi:glycine/D-amino acid oxidase-like deaminating enzyme
MIQNEAQREQYDRVVIGAGIFGLYAALLFARKGLRVLVVEKERGPLMRASHVNQARIHRGYHYPRSLSTAEATAHYVERFITEFPFAVNGSFKQIYAIAKNFSYTNATEYEKFCARAKIPCEKIDTAGYFNPTMIEAAYTTEEYGFDASAMRTYLVRELEQFGSVDFWYGTRIHEVVRDNTDYVMEMKEEGGKTHRVRTPYVVNATYAGINGVLSLFQHEALHIKYEYAEIALCTVTVPLHNVGVTVMDGPFFSLMPFGSTGLHSLSAVSYTPHKVSTTEIEEPLMKNLSRFIEMRQLARTYLKGNIDMTHDHSLFATKTILAKTELDDARPTLIYVHSNEPRLVTIMSGKLNTIFDLEHTL